MPRRARCVASDFEKKLPAELRIEIYTLALHRDSSLKPGKDARGPAALLVVNRNIYNEVHDLFYELNTFKCNLEVVCRHTKIPAARSSLLKNLSRFRQIRVICTKDVVHQGRNCLQSVAALLRDISLAPKLDKATLAVYKSSIRPTFLAQALQRNEPDVTFKDVGSIQLQRPLGADATIKLEYPHMIRTWEVISALPLTTLREYGCLNALGKSELRGVSPRLIERARHHLLSWYGASSWRNGGIPWGVVGRMWADETHLESEYRGLTESLALWDMTSG